MMVTEDEQSLTWLFETFKAKNLEVARTRIDMTDNDVNEPFVINNILPHVHLLICLFYALRSFA